jgi:hypothetical protein
MRFASARIESEWNDNKLKPILKEIVTDAGQHAAKKWNWEFFLTSIFRTKAEDEKLNASGIHVEWRAVDVRTKDQTAAAINGLAAYVNNKWIYDPLRPNLKVCFKEPHGTGSHAHFQVHPNTKLRKPHADFAAEKKTIGFRAKAEPLDQDGLAAATDLLGVKAAELWAVIDVETYGYGFIADRRPLILFERHKFHDFTNGKYDASHHDISHPKWGGYGKSGANQYNRLERAIALNRDAALRSASWGIGQVMGFNFKVAGFKDVEKMVAAMTESESKQLEAMANFIVDKKLHKALKSHDWASFALGYNGSKYAENKYDTRLAAAYQRRRIILPDLKVRAAQIYLVFLGYDPKGIDGLPGPGTNAALRDFQEDHDLQASSVIDEQLLSFMKEKIEALDKTE